MIAGGIAAEAIDPATSDAGVAAHYGDPMREQRTLLTAAGLVDRSHRGVLAVPGEERLSWLHNLTTQHLLDLPAGQGTETLVLSPHGHVEHHALVIEDGTTTWLDTEPGAAPALLDFLAKMRFLTRVEPRDATGEHAVLSLVGPATGPALAALGAAPLAAPDLVSVPCPAGRSERCWVVRLCSQLSRSSPGTATTPRWDRSTSPTPVVRVRCSRIGSP